MSQTASVWLVVALAFLAANLPFISNRLLAVYRLKSPKLLALRLAEMVVWYFVVGAIGLFLEQQAGQIAPQGWEFYAITGTLFVTFAFPGFVYRYLFKHR
jgi:tryptophan-rich sensory protein